MPDVYAQILPVVVVSAIVPILVGAMPERHRLPQVVVLLAGGVLIGPQVLDLSSSDAVTLLSDLGLGFLFLVAGYELDPTVLRGPLGRVATSSWLTSIVLAFAFVGLLAVAGLIHSPVPVAIALTTTALGVLLPILRETGLGETAMGQRIFVAGAVGELGPIVAMALLLGARGAGVALVVLVLFALLVLGLAYLPGRLKLPRTTSILLRAEHGTGQATMRLALVLLVGLLALSSALGFDAVLGAFLAGMVLRRWAPGDVELLEKKLDVLGWGVFIPVFFVSSGMNLDIDSIAANPLLPLLLLVLMLVIRGGPALFWYRSLVIRDRVQVAVFTATALPLLVALTELAVGNGSMTEAAAAAVVGAGAVSVLVFPYLGRWIGRPDAEAEQPAEL